VTENVIGNEIVTASENRNVSENCSSNDFQISIVNVIENESAKHESLPIRRQFVCCRVLDCRYRFHRCNDIKK
jgi:hypothetical protein